MLCPTTQLLIPKPPTWPAHQTTYQRNGRESIPCLNRRRRSVKCASWTRTIADHFPTLAHRLRPVKDELAFGPPSLELATGATPSDAVAQDGSCHLGQPSPDVVVREA